MCSDAFSANLLKPYPAHRHSVNIRQALLPEVQVFGRSVQCALFRLSALLMLGRVAVTRSNEFLSSLILNCAVCCGIIFLPSRNSSRLFHFQPCLWAMQLSACNTPLLPPVVRHTVTPIPLGFTLVTPTSLWVSP